MKKIITNSIVTVALGLSLMACNKGATESKVQEANSAYDAYTNIPREEMITNAKADLLSDTVYNQLCNQYAATLGKLQTAITNENAKMMVVFMSPEVGDNLTLSNRMGREKISEMCAKMNIPYSDISNSISKYTGKELTQVPLDGHWSKNGASIVANEFYNLLQTQQLNNEVKKYDNMPDVLGDLKCNNDEILDGGKNLPYRVVTNKQGFRMNSDLDKNKTKKRVLFLGDSEIFCPFLDNEYTITNVLQSKMPDTEMINAGMWGYSIDDYLSLYNSKAKYAQSNLVIIIANGNDILDQYFTNRLKFSRTKAEVKPTATELRYYQKYLSK